MGNCFSSAAPSRDDNMETRTRPRPQPDLRHWTERESDGTEPVENIRARNPPARPRPNPNRRPTIRLLQPPSQTDNPYDAAYAAATAASIGFIRALDEKNRALVAARAIHGIAVAVSTARSYSAFIAAVTAAETSALLTAEVSCLPILEMKKIRLTNCS